MRKRLPALTAAIASCVLLPGCLSLSVSPSQDGIGPLVLELTVCGSRADPQHPGCTDMGNSGLSAGGGVDTQLLVAVRVPAGAAAPDNFTATTTNPPTASLDFKRSPSYLAELEQLVPAGSGRKWAAYISTAGQLEVGPDGTPARTATMKIPIALPRTNDGDPFGGQLRARAVVGARLTSNPAAPVDCGSDPFDDNGTDIVCIDSPSKATVAFDQPYSTRDLGIVPGAATLSPGQSVNLPFDARYRGAVIPGNPAFSVTASSAIPGVAAVPSLSSFKPAANSNTRLTVPISIPRGTNPGRYPVTLTAALANGQKRSGTVYVTVRDRVAPILGRAKVRPKRFRPSKRPRKGANLTYVLNEAASVRVTMQRCARKRRGKCRRWKGVKKFSVTRAAIKGVNQVHLTGYRGKKKLPRGSYRLVITPTDAAGNRGKVARAAFAIKK